MKSNRNGKTISGFCDTMDLLKKKPRTAIELAEITGRKAETIRAHLYGLEEYAFVKRLVQEQKGWSTGAAPDIWEWQP
jgi:predicted HTH transcriptional regulator